jgi:LacI family transcriptional regulator
MPASSTAPRPHPASKLLLRPTLQDVAKQAGVARSTVSAILANKPHCYAAEETRQRVFKAAQKLNYQPNALSRALLGQQTFTIGLILRDLLGPTLKIENIARIEQLAQEKGYRLLVAAHESTARREENLIRSYLSQHVDGFIVETTWNGENDALYAKMIEEHMPLVTIDPTTPTSAAQVSVDREVGARLQVQHLLDIGRKRFLFLIESPQHPFGQAKIRGARATLNDAGIDPDKQTWMSPDGVVDSPLNRFPLAGADLTRRALEEGRKFDAIATSADSLALGAMRTLMKAGMRIPDDVAIAGFHDEMFSAALPVSLTTIRHPPDVDQLVFDMLMRQINVGSSGGEREQTVQKVVRTPTLIRRESTGFGAERDTEQSGGE